MLGTPYNKGIKKESYVMKRWTCFAIAISLVLVLLLLLAGCVGSKFKSTPTITSTPAPTATLEPPTAPTPAITPGEAIGEILSRAAGIASVKYDQVISPPGQPATMQKMWVKGSKMRIETTVSGQSMVAILNLDTQTVYAYIPAQNMATKADLPQGARSVMSLSAMEWSKALQTYPSTVVVGTETIEGKVCLVIESGTQNAMELKTWVWKEYGIPILIERLITEDKVVIEWKGIEFGEILDSMFELPSGVQIR